MPYNLPERVLDEIKEFARCHGIVKVILFGSRARGTHTDKSDIDLAVSGGNAMNYYYDLEERAHTLLMFDVVDLDKGISEDLKNDIERDGVVIYDKT